MSIKMQRLFLLLIALIMVGLAVVIMTSALRDNITFFFSPSEIAEGKVKPGQTFRAGGLVLEDSWQKSADLLTGSFVISDTQNDIKVLYQGQQLPDLFTENQGVVVRGTLTAEGTIEAQEILAKHDENYMPAEVAASLQEQGVWQGPKIGEDEK